MATVSSIMTTDILTLDPEMTLREAIEILGDGRVSGAPVLRGGRLVGVVSATDLLEFQGSNPAMEPPDHESPPSLREELEADEYDEEPELADVPDLPDHPGYYFVGLWGDGGADVYQRLAGTDSPEWDLLARHTVGEVMTRKTITLAPDTDLREAARIMTKQHVHRVLVTDGEDLRGILTTMDFVRAIADGAFQP